MREKRLLVEREHPGITLLRLNRPEKRNALDTALMNELCTALQETHSMKEQRAILLMGEGSSFCAGLDLEEAKDAEKGEESAHAVSQLLSEIYQSPLVTIAAVQGVAAAAGAGIASVCDYVVCSEEARFGFPEVRRGLVAALVMTFLKRILGEREIRELLLFGELIDAKRAREIRLVNQIVPQRELEEAALAAAERALKGAPGAISQTKRLLERLYPCSLERDLEHALVHNRLARSHIEAQEGISAFLEKREPSWCRCGF